MAVRIGILTASDRCAEGTRSDRSGDAIAAWAEEHGFQVYGRIVLPDDQQRLASQLSRWADGGEVDVIVTTGGTGLTSRDVTPEATRAVIEREAPGIAEAIRAEALGRVPTAMLSRGVAGTRGRTLIVNLPGSPGGVRDGLEVLQRVIEHAVVLLRDEPTPHDEHG